MSTFGHYHVTLDDRAVLNEKDPAKVKGQAAGRKIVNLAIVCTYGCGKLHDPTPGEVKALIDAGADVAPDLIGRKV